MRIHELLLSVDESNHRLAVEMMQHLSKEELWDEMRMLNVFNLDKFGTYGYGYFYVNTILDFRYDEQIYSIIYSTNPQLKVLRVYNVNNGKTHIFYTGKEVQSKDELIEIVKTIING